MPDEIIMAAALLVTVPFGIRFSRYQKNRKTRKEKKIEKAKAEGTVTTGTCESFRLSQGVETSGNAHLRNDTMTVRYRYTVGKTVYYKKLPFQSPGKNSVDFPSEVTVYYDARNPQKAVCPEEATPAHHRRTACLNSIAGILLFLFFMFHLLRRIAAVFSA